VCRNNVATGATGTAIGTGADNTTTIISVQGATETYAAGLARAYTGGGYTDWFLPSKDELNKMYENIGHGDFAMELGLVNVGNHCFHKKISHRISIPHEKNRKYT